MHHLLQSKSSCGDQFSTLLFQSRPRAPPQRIFSEPRGSVDKEEMNKTLGKFYAAVRVSVAAAPSPHSAAPEGSECRGALLLAVCRGKVAEGLDFTDANARAARAHPSTSVPKTNTNALDC